MGSLLYEVAVSRRAQDGREIHEVRVQIPSSGLYGCSSEGSERRYFFTGEKGMPLEKSILNKENIKQILLERYGLHYLEDNHLSQGSGK